MSINEVKRYAADLNSDWGAVKDPGVLAAVRGSYNASQH